MVTGVVARDGTAVLQLVGLVLLLAGSVWLWGAAALVVGGAAMLAGPELQRVPWARAGAAAWAAAADAWRVASARVQR